MTYHPLKADLQNTKPENKNNYLYLLDKFNLCASSKECALAEQSTNLLEPLDSDW